MITLLIQLRRLLPVLFGGHRQLAIENLALRQQLTVYKRSVTRPRQVPESRSARARPPGFRPLPAELTSRKAHGEPRAPGPGVCPQLPRL